MLFCHVPTFLRQRGSYLRPDKQNCITNAQTFDHMFTCPIIPLTVRVMSYKISKKSDHFQLVARKLKKYFRTVQKTCDFHESIQTGYPIETFQTPWTLLQNICSFWRPCWLLVPDRCPILPQERLQMRLRHVGELDVADSTFFTANTHWFLVWFFFCVTWCRSVPGVSYLKSVTACLHLPCSGWFG